MAAPRMLLFCDCLDVLDSLCQSYGIAANQQMLRQAVLDAYTEFTNAHAWTYLTAVPGRIQLQAAVSTGTVAYDHTGGTYERELTLTDSTWPTDAYNWSVRIGDAVHDIEDYKSTTVVTLDSVMNPGADVAAGTSYTAFPRWYILPSDFIDFTRPAEEADWWLGEYMPMETLANYQRYEDTTGDVEFYSVGPAPDLYGSLALYVWPPADAARTLDYVYKRRPRELRYSGKDTADRAGTITVTAASASVTGNSSTFPSDCEGSIIRWSASTTKCPTAIAGDTPYAEERAIKTYTSGTSLTLDDVVVTSRSAVKYIISDPVDIPPSLHSAFLACCRKQLADIKDFKGAEKLQRAYYEALDRAKCADAPVRQPRICGVLPRHWSRLTDGTVADEV